MFKTLSVRTKLLAGFLGVGLIPFIFIVVIFLIKSSNALSDQAYGQLIGLREVKKNQIETYFQERMGDLSVLAKSKDVHALCTELEIYHDTAVASAGGHFDINTSGYKEIEAAYLEYFSNYIKTYGYYDIFIIDSEHGRVMFTVAKEKDLGSELKNGPYKDSGLGRLWREVIESKKSVLKDFEPYAPSNNEPAAFIGAPIMKQGEMKGVVALQLSIDAIDKIMKERSGLGETGETYLVGPDCLMRSDSYLDPDNHSVKASFANPEKGSVKTIAAREALKGNTGAKIIKDYNGNRVLSAYTPVKAARINWALLAEIDESEAFGAVHQMKTMALVIGTAGAAIISILGLLFAGAITRPLLKAVRFAGMIKDGDLSFRIKMNRGDELGRLAGALDSMADKLQKKEELIRKNMLDMETVLNEVSTISEQVAAGAGQLSDSSQALSQAASEQAASMEEITSSMTQIGSQTQMNAKRAAEAKQLAADSRANAETGAEQMEKMVSAMSDINGSSAEIAKILKTIDDIAFQTNLLSLNAAVEAARAGRHGKGFAVVAEEVRGLAQRSAIAAKETAGLIEGSVKNAEKGMEIVSATSTSLNNMGESIGKVADLVVDMASAGKEQAAAVSQINQGLSQVEQVTQQNTASAEEGASVAQQLSGQSSQLNNLLVRFHNKEKIAGSLPAPGVSAMLPSHSYSPIPMNPE